MERLEPPRRLIVNADDFGLSSSVNQAVVQAHTRGILTTASLMVNEPGFAEAVELARQNPRLGVGLHLTLSHGHAASPPADLPDLVNASGEFARDPVALGCRYFFQRSLQPSLRLEIHAQFRKFHATGLSLDHVNGHLHFHLHPVVLRILFDDWQSLGIRRMRLTRDPFWLNARLARGNWSYRASHSLIYRVLSGRAVNALRHRCITHTDRVFGLLQNARVDEAYVAGLLPLLPAGDSELYSHPSLDEFKSEFDALVSPRIQTAVRDHHIRLIRYQDLNMFKLLSILLIGLAFESTGVVLLKKGMNQIGGFNRVTVVEVLRVVKAGAASPQILGGVFFEALFFGCLLILMSRADISFLWPLTGLSFVFATFAAMFFLGETVSPTRWVGVILIVIGAGFISYSEKASAKPPPAQNASVSPATQ